MGCGTQDVSGTARESGTQDVSGTARKADARRKRGVTRRKWGYPDPPDRRKRLRIRTTARAGRRAIVKRGEEEK